MSEDNAFSEGYSKTISTNAPFIEPNVLNLRLETGELIEKLQTFLSGKKTVYVQQAGQLLSHDVNFGGAIANEEGTHALTNWTGLQINPSVVQGYMKEDGQYFYYLERSRKNLAKMLLVNSPRWGIRRENRPLITNSIMNMIELFVSRTLDNTERASYTNNLPSFITPIPQQKK